MMIEMDDMLKGLNEKKVRHEAAVKHWKLDGNKREIEGWKMRLLELTDIIEWCERWQ